MQRKTWTGPLCIGGLEIDPSRFEILAWGFENRSQIRKDLFSNPSPTKYWEIWYAHSLCVQNYAVLFWKNHLHLLFQTVWTLQSNRQCERFTGLKRSGCTGPSTFCLYSFQLLKNSGQGASWKYKGKKSSWSLPMWNGHIVSFQVSKGFRKGSERWLFRNSTV